jgi:hypothetical protein
LSSSEKISVRANGKPVPQSGVAWSQSTSTRTVHVRAGGEASTHVVVLGLLNIEAPAGVSYPQEGLVAASKALGHALLWQMQSPRLSAPLVLIDAGGQMVQVMLLAWSLYVNAGHWLQYNAAVAMPVPSASVASSVANLPAAHVSQPPSACSLCLPVGQALQYRPPVATPTPSMSELTSVVK